MSTVDISNLDGEDWAGATGARSIGIQTRVLEDGVHGDGPQRGSGEVAAVSTALIAWPPNWFRSAAATFAA
jgi:hypothetical protein